MTFTFWQFLEFCCEIAGIECSCEQRLIIFKLIDLYLTYTYKFVQTCNTYTDIIPRKVISDNDSGCFHGIEDCSGASSNISSNDPHILKGTAIY